ncbi:helix-turn-helix domain-containing protein [Acetobacter sp.]|uniref:helix-turn-helix domain-containing protein n=1 Tax=Acetobacter sp. TaxID=440 RepID=UPI0039EB020A
MARCRGGAIGQPLRPYAFDLVLLNLRQDTGEVLLTRDQLAEEIGCAPRSVSTIMGTLEKMGVIGYATAQRSPRPP